MFKLQTVSKKRADSLVYSIIQKLVKNSGQFKKDEAPENPVIQDRRLAEAPATNFQKAINTSIS